MAKTAPLVCISGAFSFMCIFCRLLLIFLSLYFVHCVVCPSIMNDSDYPFGIFKLFLIIPPLAEGGGGYTVLPLSVCPSKIFFVAFFSVTVDGRNLIFGQKQASYRYIILWVAFLDPSDSYFLFADLVGFYTH